VRNSRLCGGARSARRSHHASRRQSAAIVMCEHARVGVPDAPSRYGALFDCRTLSDAQLKARSTATSTDVRAMQRITLVCSSSMLSVSLTLRVWLTACHRNFNKVHSALVSLLVAHGQV